MLWELVAAAMRPDYDGYDAMIGTAAEDAMIGTAAEDAMIGSAPE